MITNHKFLIISERDFIITVFFVIKHLHFIRSRIRRYFIKHGFVQSFINVKTSIFQVCHMKFI